MLASEKNGSVGTRRIMKLRRRGFTGRSEGWRAGLVPTPTIGTNFGTKLAVLKGTEFSVNFHEFF